MSKREPGPGPGPGSGSGSETVEPVMLAVAMSPSMIRRIDEEVEIESDRTGGEYTREQFIRHSIVELSERLEAIRWEEEEFR